ncbi:uncharacterized protein LOC131940028 [Physella acuta]|uniref:uncharacterized protein LOC131940028 n=1 Tax=Physella acuta TaxID=109671 RepID=UPI0027DAEA3A|nr:uncharacterized protein LOC131940028 [Physella acuta]
MRTLRDLLMVISLVCGSVYTTPGDTCPSPPTSPSVSRSKNRLSKSDRSPLFSLEFKEHDGSTDYGVLISVHKSTKFSNVTIFVEPTDEGCGSGRFQFKQGNYTHGARQGNCPEYLRTTAHGTHKHLPQLMWTPPFCGCVQFRAVVTDKANGYFWDDTKETNGLLSQQVCVERQTSQENYINALCAANGLHDVDAIFNNPEFIKSYKPDLSSDGPKYHLKMELEGRRFDNEQCCYKNTISEKAECLKVTGMYRVDGICRSGDLPNPFNHNNLLHLRNREAYCCHQLVLSSMSYDCFGEPSEHTISRRRHILQFSDDDTNPLNDLHIFAFETDASILNLLRNVVFQKKAEATEENSDENEDENEDKIVEGTQPEGNGEEVFNDNVGQDVKTSKEEVGKPGYKQLSVNKERQRGNAKDKDEISGELKKPVRKYGNSKEAEATDMRETEGQKHPPKSQRDRVSSAQKEVTQFDSGKVKPGASREAEAPEERVDGGRSGRQRSKGKKPLRASQEKDIRTGSREQMDRTRGQGGESTSTSNRPGASRKLTTLQKIRMMERCCEFGSTQGTTVTVYTKPQADLECADRARKFVTEALMGQGSKMCEKKYKLCCIENAQISITMTSTEFARRYMTYQQTEEEVPEEEVTDVADDLENEEAQLPAFKGSASLGRRSLEDFETESERRFKTMRESAQFGGTDLDEPNGPARFDDMDNTDNNDDVFFRGDHGNEKKKTENEKDELDAAGALYTDLEKTDPLFRGALIEDQESYRLSPKINTKKHSPKLSPARTASREVKNKKHNPSNSGVRQRSGERTSKETGRRASSRGTSREAKSMQTSSERRKLPPGNQIASFMGRNGVQDSREMRAAYNNLFPRISDSKEMMVAQKQFAKRKRHLRN